MRANCEHGVLTLTLTIPVAEAAKPRRVQVGGSSDAQTIEPQAAGGAEAIPARQRLERRRRRGRAELAATAAPARRV
jgi:hypothetical protein